MSPRARTLLVAFLLVTAGVCARLGVWQRDRLHRRRAANQLALAARSAPPLTLPAGSTPLADRRVVASGRYDRTHEVVLRNQSWNGSPVVYVVTPLRLGGSDTAVLVNRGFVSAPDAMTASLDSLDEPGDVRVTGIAQSMDSRDGGGPIVHGGRTTWRRLDVPALRRRLPYVLLGAVIRQAPDSALPRTPNRLEAPPLDDGPHLSYMLQWFGFAATALVMAVVVLRQPQGTGALRSS